MRKTILSTFLTLSLAAAGHAQRYEIGATIGASNLVGDIGPSNYLLPYLSGGADGSSAGMPVSGTAFFRFNFNPHQTIRLDVGYGHISFDDLNAKEDYRRARRYWGKNDFINTELKFEYQFFPVNNEQQGMLSPYIFAGIGGLIADNPQIALYNDFVRDADGNPVFPGYSEDFTTKAVYGTVSKFAGYIPFGVGLKYKFNYNWSLNAEVVFRPTFTDELDYSTVSEKNFKTTYNTDILDPATGKSILESEPFKTIAEQRKNEFIRNRKMGNLESKDWINSLSLGVSYSFGRPPCYCD